MVSTAINSADAALFVVLYNECVSQCIPAFNERPPFLCFFDGWGNIGAMSVKADVYEESV